MTPFATWRGTHRKGLAGLFVNSVITGPAAGRATLSNSLHSFLRSPALICL